MSLYTAATACLFVGCTMLAAGGKISDCLRLLDVNNRTPAPPSLDSHFHMSSSVTPQAASRWGVDVLIIGSSVAIL